MPPKSAKQNQPQVTSKRPIGSLIESNHYRLRERGEAVGLLRVCTGPPARVGRSGCSLCQQLVRRTVEIPRGLCLLMPADLLSAGTACDPGEDGGSVVTFLHAPLHPNFAWTMGRDGSSLRRSIRWRRSMAPLPLVSPVVTGNQRMSVRGRRSRSLSRPADRPPRQESPLPALNCPLACPVRSGPASLVLGPALAGSCWPVQVPPVEAEPALLPAALTSKWTRCNSRSGKTETERTTIPRRITRPSCLGPVPKVNENMDISLSSSVFSNNQT